MSFNKVNIAVNSLSLDDSLNNGDIPGMVAAASGIGTVHPNKAAAFAFSIKIQNNMQIWSVAKASAFG